MSKIITNDDGTETEVFTKEEVEAQLAEKDAHVKAKLDEFQKGKSSQELKDQEREAAIAEAKRVADEANNRAIEAETRRQAQVKQYYIDTYANGDPEMAKKLAEGYDLINVEIKSDEDIKRRIELSANMAGVNAPQAAFAPVMPAYGGYAPSFQKTESLSEEEHNRFLSETGLK